MELPEDNPTFPTRLEDISILNGPQQLLLSAFLESNLASIFYLSGGTALAAFHLHHRISEDLDFFTSDPVDLAAVEKMLSGIQGIEKTFFERKYDRFMYTLHFRERETVKVQFDHFPFPHLEEPIRAIRNRLRVDNLRDLLANKLHAVSERTEPKDFVDLFHLLTRTATAEEGGTASGKPHTWLVRGATDLKSKFGLDGGIYLIQSGLARVKYLRDLPETTPSLTLKQLTDFIERQLRALVALTTRAE